jgi:hypothetical protein
MYSFYKENKTPVRRRKYSIMKDFQPSPNVGWMNRPVLNCLESMQKNNRLKAPKPSGLWPVSNKRAETRKKNFRVSAIPLPKRTASPKASISASMTEQTQGGRPHHEAFRTG